jgi:hypothetical protein
MVGGCTAKWLRFHSIVAMNSATGLSGRGAVSRGDPKTAGAPAGVSTAPQCIAAVRNGYADSGHDGRNWRNVRRTRSR